MNADVVTETPPAAKPPGSSYEAPAPPAAPAEGRRRRLWPWLLGLAGAALVVYLVIPHHAKTAPPAGGGRAGGRGGGGPVPVATAPALTKDVDVYLTGLGTVTATNTVTVRSRVDGQLLRVHFQEGQLVRKGQLLAELDPRPFQVQLLSAEGQRAKDEAALANARLDLERYRALVADDSIPRQQFDTQKATVAQLEATLKSDQSLIESAKLNLSYSRITAPLTGRVGLRLVDAGNMVHASDPNGLVVIAQVDPITAVFTLPSDSLQQVLAAQRTGERLPVDALDRDLSRQLARGELAAIDNQIDPATGTVRLKAAFPNESGALFPNQFVNARLRVDTLRGVVTVPAAALQRSPQSTYVYVVKPDKSISSENVDVRLTQGDEAVIDGLAAGTQVVVDGADKLRPGMKVDVRPAGGGGPPGRSGHAGGGGGGRHAGGGAGKAPQS